jgi:CxxC-x17-CxxC domain-containing protein
MKKSSKAKPAVPHVDPYLEGLVAKLVERLAGLEKKMDTLIAQTAGRPSGGGDAAKPQPQQPPRRDRVLYEAICADCSKVCEVPFKPTEARPVYCKECWGRRKSGAAKPMNGMPVLTPVALPPKPASRPLTPQAAPAAAVPGPSKKPKKSAPAKKKKKK